jgi:hypothetical protein
MSRRISKFFCGFLLVPIRRSKRRQQLFGVRGLSPSSSQRTQIELRWMFPLLVVDRVVFSACLVVKQARAKLANIRPQSPKK